MNTKFSQLVTFLMVAVVSSTAGHAFTLGDLRGSAVLGQPLDVSVGVEPGNGETVSDDCLSAQLLFGDVPQPAPGVRVQSPAAGASPSSVVRIRSTVAVNEPVVTLLLRATCGSSTSRQYVLLSDFPVTDLPVVSVASSTRPAAASLPNQPVSPPVVTDVPPLAAASTPPAAKVDRPAAAARPTPARTAPAKPEVTKPRSPAAPPASEAPLNPPPVVVPDTGRLVLKLDDELVILNPDELAALAALRLSLPKLEPEGEVLKQSLQLEALQNDLKVFKDLTSQNQATLAALEAQLGQAEANRLPMVWLYGLGALLIAALGALAWVLRQQQRAKQAWWQQADDQATEMIAPASNLKPYEPATEADPMNAAPTPPVPAVPVVPPVAAMPAAPPVMPGAPTFDLDFDLDQLVETAAPAPAPAPASMPVADAVLPSASRLAPLVGTSDLNSETVADIRQQAEFFVSLGQAQRAINLLQRHVQESTEPHPRVFLDLLTLYHSQGMKTEFRELRLEFNRLFNAATPDFPAFYQEGKGLLDYPETLAELVSAWPDWEAAALLDACIFRSELSGPQAGYDLAAFRDLLLLRTLVENVQAANHNLLAKPTVNKAQPSGALRADSNAAAAQATLPASMPVTQSAWLTPPAVPTAEELELDFPIDMLDIVKKPKG